MTGATVGFFGKLPSHGDFVERRIAPAFRDVWDDWLQRCVAASRAALDAKWLDVYLTSPIWRFFLSDGIAGGASYGGVLVPSVDRVGRYFPLTIVAELPAGLGALQFAYASERWLREVEDLVLDALHAAEFDLQAFDEALMATGTKLQALPPPLEPTSFPAGATQWRCAIASSAAMGQGLSGLLIEPAERALRPLSLWWTDGSDLIRPSALLVRSLPDPASYTAMLAGMWAQSGWAGDIIGEETHARAGVPTSYKVGSAGVTDAGPVRPSNQDNFAVSDDNRIWAVADGMGGHQGGEAASQMVVDAIYALEPTASLNSAMQSVHVALERVNADLRRPGLGQLSADAGGATVVVLMLRDAEWGVAWAGDSRAYLLRDGDLMQLTDDHSLENELRTGQEAGGAVPRGGNGIVTRAVGGEDVLRLDQVSDTVRIGDRFLLCSDGLYNTLDPAALRSGLSAGDAMAAAHGLIEEAKGAGARDNVTALVVDVLPGD